jgi:DNA-binding transcriptional LysR family regulator
MSLPSLRAVKAFGAVAREGSFARAAAQLGISRSAVSHLIADLERQVGARLLERKRGHIEPTHDGKALLGGLGDAILRIEAAVEALRVDRSSIRLTTVSSLASCWLLPRLPRLQAVHPHLQLSISTTIHTVDFSSEDVDCGIRTGMGSWPGLEATLLFMETLVLAGPPSLLRRINGRSVARSLHSVPIIAAHSRRKDLLRWWQGNGFEGSPPRPKLFVETRSQALAAASAGGGLTVTDGRYFGAPGPYNAIERLPGREIALPEGHFFVVPHRNAGRRNIKLLRAWLTSEI